MEKILLSIYLHRDLHENGMTLEQFAAGVMCGEQHTISRSELAYQFGATDESLEIVRTWAENNDFEVVDVSKGASTIKLLGDIATINSTFGIEMDFVVTRSRSYWTYKGTIVVPTEIKDYVCHIEGLDNSVQFTSNLGVDPNWNQNIDPKFITSPTPIDLAVAYNFPRSAGTNQQQGYGQCIGIISLGGGWTQSNLNSSFPLSGLTPPTVVNVSVDGGTNNPADANSSIEVMLDIYCSGAVAPGARIVNYIAPNTFQGFVDAVLATTTDYTNFPKQVSISWGTVDTYWTTNARTQMENAFASCVALGITVFVAAGDYGTQAVSGANTYTVDYPASSQYVVACGGTVIVLNNNQTRYSETSWSDPYQYATGGGISQLFSVPAWQTGCLATLYPDGTSSPITGRGIPDIAAMAKGYAFYYGSNNTYISGVLGTSAVAPLMAGMCARLNQSLPKNLGFVNSTWYANRTSAFYDITTGDNAAPATVGYYASPDWDACTGIGAPNGNAILKLSNVGTTYPADNYGFRPAKATGGAAWPRTTTGVR